MWIGLDTEEDGGCGFCYGDQPDKSLNIDNAYYFRMVSDVWRYEELHTWIY